MSDAKHLKARLISSESILGSKKREVWLIPSADLEPCGIHGIDDLLAYFHGVHHVTYESLEQDPNNSDRYIGITRPVREVGDDVQQTLGFRSREPGGYKGRS